MRLLHDLWDTSPRRMAAVVLLILLGAAGSATTASLAGQVLVDRSALAFTGLAVALVLAVSSDLLVGLVTAGLTADWAADVRRRLCRVAFAQDLPTLEATPVGELLDRIDGDVEQVASELRFTGVRMAQDVATGAGAVVAAFVVWWPAGSTMLALVAVLVLGLRGPARRISTVRMAEEEAWSDLAAVTEEAVHGQDDVRTSLAQPYVLRLFAGRASEVLRRGRRVWHLSAWVTSTAGFAVRVVIAAVVCGGLAALGGGHLDAARLSALWFLALSVGGVVQHVSRQVPELQYALGAWGRVQLLRDSPTEPVGGVPPREGDVEVRGLTFRYRAHARAGSGSAGSGSGGPGSGGPGAGGGRRAAARPALEDVHLRFVRGRSYALIGRTGSGKSTLGKVLTRAVDVPRGTVFLDGTDLLDLDLEGLRRWVAVVPQRTEVLSGTLAENVALFDETLLPAAGDALHQLGLDAWVAGLPDGLQTRLGEGGHVLSAGQEQLVAFARILVRDPHVVVLDEATARLDPVTEAQVQRATERLLAGRIGIVIAHRLSSVRRCDEVVVLADGRVVEAGPLRTSQRYARLAAAGRPGPHGGLALAERDPEPAADQDVEYDVEPDADPDADRDADRDAAPDAGPEPGGPAGAGGARPPVPAPGAEPSAGPGRADPPPLPPAPPVRTMREIFRLVTNDRRYGLGAVAVFSVMVVLGLDGSVLPWLWADVVDGEGSPWGPAAAVVATLLVTAPAPYLTATWFPEWWVRQNLRIGLRLVHGQTGPRRVSSHTPAEVVAQGGDTERVVMLADSLIDQFITGIVLVAMVVVSGTWVTGAFFAGTVLASGLAATAFGPRLERSARRTVAARAAFATALVSSLSAARTVKLAGAVRPVTRHLARLDATRSDRLRHEIVVKVWSRSTPSVLSGLAPAGVWALYLAGGLSSGGALVAVSTLASARWFAWTTASLVSQLPSARVWTRRTVAMCGTGAYSVAVPGVDLSAGTAPGPVALPRQRLGRLELAGFGAVHEDGTVGVRDVDLTVERGQLVLVVGPVGCGKSSLLRALAGIVHHIGSLRWNGQPVEAPELFLRPAQVGYVGQVPRVLSGSVADNIRLGHDLDPVAAVSVAQLDHDLAAAEGGLGLLIGHKGTRLSGGQLQRLALARALAPRTELLVADDVSSALDVTTELDLWRALRERGLTVIGSTSKRAALAQADLVVVLAHGRPVARGRWDELEDRWGHLAG